MTENATNIVTPDNYAFEDGYLVDERTGEAEKAVVVALRPGSRVLTPERKKPLKIRKRVQSGDIGADSRMTN